MAFRRMLPLIILNVIVSAVVVLAILYWWDSRQEPEEVESPPTFAAVLPVPTALPTLTDEVDVAPVVEFEEEGPEIYLVQRGDSLGSISNKFGIPMVDIMEVNGIEDPNFLQVDQELIIPIEGYETPLPKATPAEETALLPSPIPTALPMEGEALLEIGQIVGLGDITNEAVTITNNGERPILLQGWKISDGDGNEYTFGQLTLFGEGAAITIHTKSGQDGPSNLYWGMQDAVWQSGEAITLLDLEGSVRATVIAAGP